MDVVSCVFCGFRNYVVNMDCIMCSGPLENNHSSYYCARCFSYNCRCYTTTWSTTSPVETTAFTFSFPNILSEVDRDILSDMERDARMDVVDEFNAIIIADFFLEYMGNQSRDGLTDAARQLLVPVTEYDRQENCPICIEKFDENIIIKMPCTHLFHKTCIDSWIERNASCPICRDVIQNHVN